MRNENHPSFGTDCSLQYSVTPRPSSWTMAGFGCSMTGSHCIPGKHCEKLRADYAKDQQFKQGLKPSPI